MPITRYTCTLDLRLHSDRPHASLLPSLNPDAPGSKTLSTRRPRYASLCPRVLCQVIVKALLIGFPLIPFTA